jgi:predicted dehydrogenase
MASLPAGAKKKLKYRVAIVGCGKIGALFEAEPKREKPASHAGAAMANDRTNLVALVDTNAKNLAIARELFPSARGYISLIDCLNFERPDIVIIATPPTARSILIRECLRFEVRMIICEKPLAMSAKEAKQIETLIAGSETILVLNYQRHFSPLFAQVRTDIKKGKLGRIQQVTCYYSNGLYSNGGHIVDALLYLLDDIVASAIGLKNDMNKIHSVGDLNVDALLTTKKGTKVVLQSFDQKKYGIHDIRLYGTKGSVVLTDYGMTYIKTPVHSSRFAGVRQLDVLHGRTLQIPFSATKDALAYTIQCYERHRSPSSSATSGFLVMRVLDAIAESAKRGGKKVLV